MPFINRVLNSFIRLFQKSKKTKKHSPKSKKSLSRPLKKTAPSKKISNEKKSEQSREVVVGKITHFFSRIGVVVVEMAHGEIHVGETIHIKGKTTNFTQKISSLQIESVDVKSARRGQLVGLKVSKPAKPGDLVLKSKV